MTPSVLAKIAPSRGLCRWRTALRWMTLIARARRIISPDETIEIRRAGGRTILGRRFAVQSAPSDPFWVTRSAAALRCTGGRLRVASIGSWDVPDDFLTMVPDSWIVVHLRVRDEGIVTVPVFDQPYDTGEVTVISEPALEIATMASLTSATYLMPGSVAEADVRIPVAYIAADGRIENELGSWTGGGMTLELYHGHWTLLRGS